MKTLNSTKPSKYAIKCENNKYQICDIEGTVPPNKNCIIEGWHIVSGKIKIRGNIHFVPGTGEFMVKGNIIECSECWFSGKVSVFSNLFKYGNL